MDAGMLQKHKPIRLDKAELKRLYCATGEADHWRCMNYLCWSMDKRNPNALQPHHIQYRSQGGSDIIENLILLCPQCHHKVHHGCKHPRSGVWMSGHEYMKMILDAYLGTDRFRWHNAYEHLVRALARRGAPRTGGGSDSPAQTEGEAM